MTIELITSIVCAGKICVLEEDIPVPDRQAMRLEDCLHILRGVVVGGIILWIIVTHFSPIERFEALSPPSGSAKVDR